MTYVGFGQVNGTGFIHLAFDQLYSVGCFIVISKY